MSPAKTEAERGTVRALAFVILCLVHGREYLLNKTLLGSLLQSNHSLGGYHPVTAKWVPTVLNSQFPNLDIP